MCFIHIADIHLGYQQYGSKERFGNFGRQQVGFVLLTDDLFEKRTQIHWPCAWSSKGSGCSADVAFFDEPTANLDDHWRDSLAEQILNVKGFSQLCVISHDDTFERDTDNVVRVVKEGGVSRVVEA